MIHAYAVRMNVIRRPSTQKTVALLYLRVSTIRQVIQGVSLEMQEVRCKAFCEQHGWEVAEIFKDEGISGRASEDVRPGFSALLKRFHELKAQNQNVVVVFYSLSRLVRSQGMLWRLLDKKDGEGLEIASVTESLNTVDAMGRMVLGVLSAINQFEAEIAAERTRDSLAEVKAQGTRLGRITFDEFLQGNPQVADKIRELNQRGFTLREAAAELTTLKVPTPRGGSWTYDAVARAERALSLTRM
jgi:site-specific DNA recombinase